MSLAFLFHEPRRWRRERLDPAIATTAFMKENREGKVFADSTRVGGATVIAAYSPRVRPGVPVSFPVACDELDAVAPGDFTVHTAVRLVGDRDPWSGEMPGPRHLFDRPGRHLTRASHASEATNPGCQIVSS